MTRTHTDTAPTTSRLAAWTVVLVAFALAVAPAREAAAQSSGSSSESDDEYLVEPKGDQGDDSDDSDESDDDSDESKKEGDDSGGSADSGQQPARPDRPAEKQNKGREREEKVEEALRRQVLSGQEAVPIYQIVEEMIDEVVLDVRDLRTKVVSPAAMRKMGLTPNLSDQFGDFVEATLVNALANDTEVAVKRCEACQALRSRIEDGNWVVSMGMTRQKELRKEAERLGVETFLNARFSFFPAANIAALNVEFVRANDGKILWSETYRSDSTTAAILRSGDRTKTRRERVRELERKIEERPYYGYMIYLGATSIPYDSPQVPGNLGGSALGLRLYEEWGPQQRWRYGVGAEAFANFSDAGLVGAFLGATLQYDILEPNLNWPTVRTGPSVWGFFSGFGGPQQANSGAIEWGLDVIMQFRLGAGASIMYFVPTEFAGSDLGGFSFKARISFNW